MAKYNTWKIEHNRGHRQLLFVKYRYNQHDTSPKRPYTQHEGIKKKRRNEFPRRKGIGLSGGRHVTSGTDKPVKSKLTRVKKSTLQNSQSPLFIRPFHSVLRRRGCGGWVGGGEWEGGGGWR